ncbi:MAG: hypothetical protein V1725_02770 [archaeon]
MGLQDYVRQQLNAGYAKEQIILALKRAGYAERDIASAFQQSSQQISSPAVSPLVSYVQDMLRRGYAPLQVRQWLLQQGYTSADVDAAFGTSVHVHHIATGSIVKVIFALFIIGLFIGGGFFAVQHLFTKQGLLDYSLSNKQSTLLPGDTVRFSADLVNLGKGRFDVTLTHKLVDSTAVVLDEAKETIAVDTSVRRSVELTLPKWVPAGKYTVLSEAAYEDKTATASFSITIISNTPSRPSPVVQNATNASNGSSTPLPSSLPDEYYDIIIDENPVIPAACTTSSCIINEARMTNNPYVCSAITDAEDRDSCLLQFMNQGNYAVCNLFTNATTAELCSKLYYFKTLSDYAQNNQTQEILLLTNVTYVTVNATANETDYTLDDVIG